MTTRDVLPRLAALAQDKTGKIWDVPAVFQDPAYLELALWIVRKAQQDVQPAFEALEVVSKAALQDILELKSRLSGEVLRAFDFIHFDLCITPLGFCAAQRRLEPMFDWIARSLVERVEIERSVE